LTSTPWMPCSTRRAAWAAVAATSISPSSSNSVTRATPTPEKTGSIQGRYRGVVDVTPLVRDAGTKIVLVVMDGLGGFADAGHGTELEEADTPNLDALAAEGCTGLGEPVGPGITPGSGPGHLALFGYDPEVYELGRGALSAAGLEFPLGPGDVAARANLCTLDAAGHVVDRRAGRIPDPEAKAIVQVLADKVRLDGAEAIFRHEREHRVLVVLRGAGLDP